MHGHRFSWWHGFYTKNKDRTCLAVQQLTLCTSTARVGFNPWLENQDPMMDDQKIILKKIFFFNEGRAKFKEVLKFYLNQVEVRVSWRGAKACLRG